jgi:hypothetical protein
MNLAIRQLVRIFNTTQRAESNIIRVAEVTTDSPSSLLIARHHLSGVFPDFLLGPFLQRRLSLAEQLGWGRGGEADTCTQ